MAKIEVYKPTLAEAIYSPEMEEARNKLRQAVHSFIRSLPGMGEVYTIGDIGHLFDASHLGSEHHPSGYGPRSCAIATAKLMTTLDGFSIDVSFSRCDRD